MKSAVMHVCLKWSATRSLRFDVPAYGRIEQPTNGTTG